MKRATDIKDSQNANRKSFKIVFVSNPCDPSGNGGFMLSCQITEMRNAMAAIA